MSLLYDNIVQKQDKLFLSKHNQMYKNLDNWGRKYGIYTAKDLWISEILLSFIL